VAAISNETTNPPTNHSIYEAVNQFIRLRLQLYKQQLKCYKLHVQTSFKEPHGLFSIDRGDFSLIVSFSFSFLFCFLQLFPIIAGRDFKSTLIAILPSYPLTLFPSLKSTCKKNNNLRFETDFPFAFQLQTQFSFCFPWAAMGEREKCGWR